MMSAISYHGSSISSLENHIMSNTHIAIDAALPAAEAASATSATRPSFWRRLFDAWVAVHAQRIDANGNFICEH